MGKVDEISKTLGRIEANQISHAAEHQADRARISRVELTVYGNDDHIGLVGHVRNLDTNFQSIKGKWALLIALCSISITEFIRRFPELIELFRHKGAH